MYARINLIYVCNAKDMTQNILCGKWYVTNPSLSLLMRTHLNRYIYISFRKRISLTPARLHYISNSQKAISSLVCMCARVYPFIIEGNIRDFHPPDWVCTRMYIFYNDKNIIYILTHWIVCVQGSTLGVNRR